MHEAGWSYHKSEKRNPKRDPEQVEERREEIKKKLAQHQDEIESGELIVLVQDECHLLWGDSCGYVWGASGASLYVEMTNQKQRQTYYGAINWQTGQVHLKAFDAGNSQNTVAYLRWLEKLYPGKKLLLLWDGASYHRNGEIKEFLAQVNAGLSEEDWRVTLCPFAPNAPEQNPVEDLWLAGKNHVRRCFAQNKTFAQVKACFSSFVSSFRLNSVKFDWYAPSPQII